MGKKIRPDDYYNNGFFEIARFGKLVSMRNNGTSEMNKRYQEMLADNYDILKSKIDENIKKIIEKVKIVNPENMMNFLVSMNFMSMINKMSEIQYTSDECFDMRAVEYIQSVLLTYGDEKIGKEEDQTALYGEIQYLTSELYKKLQMFYPCWAAKMLAEKKIDNDEVLKYVMEAQITSTVRGNRYQQFQIPFLRQLLLPHNEAFVKAYGITSKELLLGLEQLEYSLSSGKVDAIKDMQSMMDTFGEAVDNSSSEEEVNKSIDSVRDENYGLFQKLIGLDLYDVKKVTTWSDKIISCLSYEIGNEKSLFAHDEFNG